MLRKIKELFSDSKPLEERISSVILVVGSVVVLASAIITSIQNFNIYATIASDVGALFFFLTALVNYKFKAHNLAKNMLCYVVNCLIIPAAFFSCGGIDCGMILYLLAGLFLVIPTLAGKSRVICLVVSTISDTVTVGISYFFMDEAKTSWRPKVDLIGNLSLEDRVIDMVVSLLLVSAFVCIATYMILRAYQKEREKKEALLERLNQLSKRDALTNLYNRRELFLQFEEQEILTKDNAYVAMLDIDHFKDINDSYGHVFGDLVLKVIAAELMETSVEANGELAARYGGEEFILLLYCKSLQEAYNRVENLRERIEHLTWEMQENLVITISGGVIGCKGYNALREMISKADKQLYRAKNDGRNRTCTDQEVV